MTKQNADLSLGALFKLIWRNKRLLAILALTTIIASSIVSMLLTEYYKSTVIIFPARINSLSLNESTVKRGNISDFGEEEEAEQMLQIINSESLQEMVIDANGLYDHYEVDKKEKYARSKIRQLYNNNVTAKRTKYNSIDISVIDEEPIMAARIANSIAAFADTVKNDMIRQRAITSMSMIDQEFERLESELDALNHKLDSLQMIGVVSDIERASLFEAYGNARKNSDSQTTRELQTQLELNRKLGDEYDAMKRQRNLVIDQLLRFRNLRNQFIADSKIDIPQKFVVDAAIPADKKAYPIRWLIVLGSLFSVMLFTLILLIVRDNYRSIFLAK